MVLLLLCYVCLQNHTLNLCQIFLQAYPENIILKNCFFYQTKLSAIMEGCNEEHYEVQSGETSRLTLLGSMLAVDVWKTV